MENIFNLLMERDFIEQTTHEDEIKELLSKGPVKFYVGFDPTADSLHLGHFVQIMVMKHMQNAGHIPIALVGGGTAKIGDPSGRTDMRQMLTDEQLVHNTNSIKAQISKYIEIGEGKGYIVNNADWLDNLSYIPFIREIGSRFSVNRMLTAECFKQRMEKGLSFLEFNYMIMQAYDFLELNRRLGCELQLGGNDQWSNIIAGTDLVRRVEGKSAYGLTFKLLLTSTGVKMGKTQNGAVWVDPNKTSPYELFQYLRNVEDADVENCLKLLTFLPIEEIRILGSLEGAEINQAKERLAFEFTKIVHGEEEAQKALEASKALFSNGGQSDNVPCTQMSETFFKEGMGILDLMFELKLIPSKAEGRRIVVQKGVSINGETIDDPKYTVTLKDFQEGSLLIKKGKKVFHQVTYQ